MCVSRYKPNGHESGAQTAILPADQGRYAQARRSSRPGGEPHAAAKV